MVSNKMILEDLFIIKFLSEMTFLETSALTGENVEEIFLKTARSILTKIEAGIHTIYNICTYT